MPKENRDEFSYGEALPERPRSRLIAIVVLVVFVVVTLGTGVADVGFGVEGVQLVGQELKDQRKLEAEVDLWDGTLSRYYESKLRQHSLVREMVLPYYAYGLFAYLDEAPAGIAIGAEHWMFLENRIELQPLSDEQLACGAMHSVMALDRRLASRGVKFHALPIPRKSYVARDRLPAHVDGRHQVDDMILDGLLARGISTTDLRPVYADAEPEDIYFKLDTHWTPHAARLAAEQVSRDLGRWKPEAERLGVLELHDTAPGSRLGLATLRSIGVDPSEVDLSVFEQPPVKVSRVRGDRELMRWLQAPKPITPIALAGTSFSQQQAFARLLTHFLGAGVFDGAKEARPYMTTAGQVLEQYEENGKLRLLIWEFPIATVFNRYNARGGWLRGTSSQAFAVFHAGECHEVLDLTRAVSRLPERPDGSIPKGRHPLIQLPRGTLAHTGEGVVSLELVGELQGAPLEISVASPSYTTEVELEPGELAATIPLISLAATTENLRVFVVNKRPTRLRVDSARLVVESGDAERTALRVRPRPKAVLLEARPPLDLGRRPALVVHTRADRGEARDLRVRLHGEAKQPVLELEFPRIRDGVTLVVDLGRLGAELRGVELVADGAPLEVTEAWVTGLAR